MNKYCTDRAIYLSESHDHRWAKTTDEGGSLLSMSSIKLGLLKKNDKQTKVEIFLNNITIIWNNGYTYV